MIDNYDSSTYNLTQYLGEVGENMRVFRTMRSKSRRASDKEAGRDALDILRATIPVGTPSGSPKVRIMELIDELDPTPGAAGHIGSGRKP